MYCKYCGKENAKKSIVVNEIVGNLKMMGCALLIFLLYMVFLSIVQFIIADAGYDGRWINYRATQIYENKLQYERTGGKDFVLTDELENTIRKSALYEAKREAKRATWIVGEVAVSYALRDHALWAALIALSLMIGGRYFVKAYRWVSDNRLPENEGINRS